MSLRSLLGGLRIIEGSAFVAAPLAGLNLAQLGAEVIRFDDLGGGLDSQRWPLSDDGKSLFWAGLNRGKRSLELSIRSEEGQKIITELITAPGEDSGIFITNFPASGWMSYDKLVQRRSDLIMVVLTGNFDGSSEVDYTVNPSFGFPYLTGPRESSEPVNSVMPVWDFILGTTAALAIVAAVNNRIRTGKGELITISLSDIALASVGAIGRLSRAYLGDQIVRDGNFLYGAFGHNFTCKDGREIMVVGLTTRQWHALLDATSLANQISELSSKLGVSFEAEGQRFQYRNEIAQVFRKWFAERNSSEVSALLREKKASWSFYQNLTEFLKDDVRASSRNPIFNIVDEPTIGTSLPNITSPIRTKLNPNLAPMNAPVLGEANYYVLSELLNYSDSEISRLQNLNVIPDPTTKKGSTP